MGSGSTKTQVAIVLAPETHRVYKIFQKYFQSKSIKIVLTNSVGVKLISGVELKNMCKIWDIWE